MSDPNGVFSQVELFEQLELTESRRFALWNALYDVIGIVDRAGGFLSHGDQRKLWNARSKLMENEG